MRKYNWATLYADYLSRAEETPFEWGKQDCFLFASGGIAAMTGVDIAHAFRGAYTTMEGAYTLMRNYLELPVEELSILTDNQVSVLAFTKLLSRPGFTIATNILHAKRGDVAIVQTGHKTYAAGLISMDGRKVMVAAARGIYMQPLNTIVHLWHAE